MLETWLPLRFNDRQADLTHRDVKMKVPPAISMKTKDAQQKVMRNTGRSRRFHLVLATIEAEFGSFVFLARNPASD